MQIAVIWHALSLTAASPKPGDPGDPPLCARGRRQAEETAHVLHLVLPANPAARPVILHSPALRAKETAEIIGGYLNADLVLEDDALGERSWPSEAEADAWVAYHAKRLLTDDGVTRILVTHMEPLRHLARALPALYDDKRVPIVGNDLKPILAPGRGFYLGRDIPTHVSIRPNA